MREGFHKFEDQLLSQDVFSWHSDQLSEIKKKHTTDYWWNKFAWGKN